MYLKTSLVTQVMKMEEEKEIIQINKENMTLQ